MDKQKYLITIIVLVIVATVASVVGIGYSLGWISANRNLDAEGQALSAEVPDNILISTNSALNAMSTVPVAQMDNYNFSGREDFSVSGILFPASFDGETFRYATIVDENGHALDPENEDVPTYSVVPAGSIQTFRYTNVLHLATTNFEEKQVYISRVEILQGSSLSSELYKAVRISFQHGDDMIVFRYPGQVAYPANGADTVMAADFAVDTDDIDSEDDDTTLIIDLDAVTIESDGSYTASVEDVIIQIWIEGTNSNAVVDYAGTGFMVAIEFALVES